MDPLGSTWGEIAPDRLHKLLGPQEGEPGPGLRKEVASKNAPGVHLIGGNYRRKYRGK